MPTKNFEQENNEIILNDFLNRYFNGNIKITFKKTKTGQEEIYDNKFNITRIDKKLKMLKPEERRKIDEYIKEKNMNDDEKAEFFAFLGGFLRKTNNKEEIDWVGEAISCHREKRNKSKIILDNLKDTNNTEIVSIIYDYIDKGKNPSEINRNERGFSSLEEFLNSLPEDEYKNIVVGIINKYREKINSLTSDTLARRGITPNELANQLDSEENKALYETFSEFRNFHDKYRKDEWVRRPKRKKFENLTIEEKKEEFKRTLATLYYDVDIDEKDFQEEININETLNEITYEIINRERIQRRGAGNGFVESTTPSGEKGRELAEKYNLGPTLANKFSEQINEKINIDDPRVFRYARRKFCDNNKNLNLGGLPIDLVNNLYKETNNFKDFKLEGKKPETIKNLRKFKALFGRHIKEYKQACENLGQRFHYYLQEAQDKVSNFHSIMFQKKEIIKNNISIGLIIDGIKNIFTNLGRESDNQEIQNIELDKDKPVELENDGTGLILTGTFKGNPVKIKYDLMTGNVYMNTCISKTMPYTLTYGRKEPDFLIGKISDFASILDNYKDNSDNSQNQGMSSLEERKAKQENQKDYIDKSVNERLMEIQNKIGPYLESNQAKNEASTNLLKTLGIIKPLSDNNNPNGKTKYEDRIIEFEEGSDAYKVIEIINNSETKDIKAFSEGMKTLTRFAGRNRGNKEPNKNSKEYKEFTGTIDQNIRNPQYKQFDNLRYFLSKIKDLDNDFNYTGPEGNISKNYKNSFISIIYEKFTNEEDPPKLNQEKIETFIQYLKCDKDLMITLCNLK